MNIGTCRQAWRHAFVAIALVQVVLLWPSLVFAQTKSLLDQGVGAVMYGRCQVDTLTGDLRRATVVLGVFAPDAVTRLVTDENAENAKLCAQQIHQQRCSKDMVNLVGDLLTAGRPGDKFFVPPLNPGTALGAMAGAWWGYDRGGLLGAAAGGFALGSVGGFLWNAQHATGCIDSQRALDTVSLNLRGSVRVLSASALIELIESNVGGAISRADADALMAETNKLSVRYIEVLNSLR